jgi:sulfur carrier protein
VITVNGEQRGLGGATVADVLEDAGVGAEGRGIAVAVDAEVVPKSEWATFVVEDGAHVEVVTAVQGG